MLGSGELTVALAWGALSSVGLLIGALAGAFLRLPHRAIALTMSVGAGLLLAAASLELATEAVAITGTLPAIGSLLFGAAVFSTANAILSRYGAANRKRCGECAHQATEEQPGSGLAIALGTAIDAIPEALVLGLTLRLEGFPLNLLVAIAVGNLAEALSGAAGMRAAARSTRYILLLWTTIALGVALATAAGRSALGLLGASAPPHLQAFGAGALLAMTAETMVPEAFHNGPRFSGFLAALGFCVVLLLGAAAH